MKPSFASLGVTLHSVAVGYGHPWATALGRRLRGSPLAPGRLLRMADTPKASKEGVKLPRDERLTRLEAVFFLSQQPQTSRRLAQLAGLADGTKARTLVRALNQRYDAEGSAFRVEEVAGGFQLMTRSKFAPWLRRLHSAPEVRLSAPAMETMAVVAYRQPVLRAEIEAIRGVQSGEILRQLIERDFVRIAGRSDDLGRPFLYGTTKQFLQVFGLRHLDELPRADLLRRQQPQVTQHHTVQTNSNQDPASETNQSQAVEEETNVKTDITTRLGRGVTTQCHAAAAQPRRNGWLGGQGAFDKKQDDEEDFEDEDEDLEDEEEADDEEEDDDDLDDEPWEEVEDDDEGLEEEEDEDWDEDDDDWDDEEEEDWEDDEDDDWEEEGEEEEEEGEK